jgi:hypothetical protein
MTYKIALAPAEELQERLNSLELDYRVRQIYPLLNDRFMVFAELRRAESKTAPAPRKRGAKC